MAICAMINVHGLHQGPFIPFHANHANLMCNPHPWDGGLGTLGGTGGILSDDTNSQGARTTIQKISPSKRQPRPLNPSSICECHLLPTFLGATHIEIFQFWWVESQKNQPQHLGQHLQI